MSGQAAWSQVPGPVLYGEDRCGLSWPLVASAVIGWVAMVAGGVAMNLPHLAGLVVIAVAGAIWGLVMTASVLYGLPLGIRVGREAISIGGISGRERSREQGKWPPRKPLAVGQQNKAVFTCPWDGVRSLYLVTSVREVRRVRRDFRRFIVKSDNKLMPLGAYRQALYFAKGALIITNDPRFVSSDPPEFRTSRGQYGARIHATESPTWMVPTRNPEALRAALAQVPGAPRVQEKLPQEAIFQFFSGRA